MWPMILAALGSAVLSNQNAKGVAKKQSQLAGQNDIYAKQRVANAQLAIDRYLNRGKGDARAAEQAEVKKELSDDLRSSVGAVEKFSPTPIIEGKLTPGYHNRLASNRSVNDTKMAAMIDQLSRINAPGQTAFRDAREFGRSAMSAGAEYDDLRSMGGAYQNAIDKVKPNPLLTMMSQALQGYAIGQAMGGAGAAKPPAGTALSTGRAATSQGLGYSSGAGPSLSSFRVG